MSFRFLLSGDLMFTFSLTVTDIGFEEMCFYARLMKPIFFYNEVGYVRSCDHTRMESGGEG